MLVGGEEDGAAGGTLKLDDCWDVDGCGGCGLCDGLDGGALGSTAVIAATTFPSAREKEMKPLSVQQLPDTRFLSQQYTPLWHRRIASLPAADFWYVQI